MGDHDSGSYHLCQVSSLPFWCLDAKGGESVGFASLVSLCFCFIEPSLLWFGLLVCVGVHVSPRDLCYHMV